SPKEGFSDRLSGDVAGDFATVREALLRPTGPATKDWQQVLEKHGVDHVVLYVPSAEGVKFAYRNLSLEPRKHEPKDWVELHRDGRMVVFGWVKKQPKEQQEAYRKRGLDIERLAYSRDAVVKV